MRSRFLSGFVLAVICFVGTAFVIYALSVPRPQNIQGAKQESTRGRNSRERGGISDVLSRLRLLPFGSRERDLFSVIIENHEDARRYQQGLPKALLIQEYPVEGFITRFLATFAVDDVPELLGPVRSLRPYFVETVLPWKTPLLFAGGSPEALERAGNVEGLTAINGLRYPKEFMRDDGIPAPHNLFVDEKAVLFLVNEHPAHVEWPPYTLGAALRGSGALSIMIDYSNPAHNTVYTFDYFSQGYIRDNGGMTSDTRPRNVLIMEIPVTSISEYGRLWIPLIGQGRAVLFREGRVIQATWKRQNFDAWFTLEQESGSPLLFARGQTWMTVVPAMDRVKWSEKRER